jgi:hypothetical protein
MNLSIATIEAYIHKHRLMDNVTENDLYKCEIIGVSTYINQPITFTILIEKSWLYSNIPINWLFHNKNIDDIDVKFDNLRGINCPKLEIDYFILNKLNDVKVNIDNKWVSGFYKCSFDFYSDNELLHLISLYNGQFGLFPNNRLSFNKEELPKFKKQRNIK